MGGNRAKGERERVGTLNRKQMASIGARNTEKHRKKKNRCSASNYAKYVLETAEEGNGMEQRRPSDVGLGVSPRRGMPMFSVGFSQREREKMLYEQSVIRNSKHALSSG